MTDRATAAPTPAQLVAAEKLLKAGWRWQDGFGPEPQDWDEDAGLYLERDDEDDPTGDNPVQVMIDRDGLVQGEHRDAVTVEWYLGP